MLGFSIGRVYGKSMLPKIKPDSYILSFYFPKKIVKKTGQIFYIKHPRYGYIIKTFVTKIDDKLWFSGENKHSISSQEIGPIDEKDIIGRVIWIVSAN